MSGELLTPNLSIPSFKECFSLFIVRGQSRIYTYIHAGGQEAGEQPPGKGSQASDLQQVVHQPAVCTGSKKGRPYPGVHQALLAL